MDEFETQDDLEAWRCPRCGTLIAHNEPLQLAYWMGQHRWSHLMKDMHGTATPDGEFYAPEATQLTPLPDTNDGLDEELDIILRGSRHGGLR